MAAAEVVTAPVVEKKGRKPGPKKTKSASAKGRSEPAHPSYLQMSSEAIVSLKERSGSSQYAIAKYIDGKYKSVLPPNFRKLLSVQLRNLVKQNKLVKVKASYKLSEELKKQVGAKKGKTAAPKATKTSTTASKTPKSPKKSATRKKKAVTPKKPKVGRKKTATKKAAPKKITTKSAAPASVPVSAVTVVTSVTTPKKEVTPKKITKKVGTPKKTPKSKAAKAASKTPEVKSAAKSPKAKSARKSPKAKKSPAKKARKV